ncbi:DUF2189 domain-containing protein [Aliiroseovarius crassostreae]|uniref:DUF2189 domain-containing protein n=1 Tax=Aliiroseovarius crassostreae TaxID=154981 RepID=UPI0021FF9C08|nr:DUF2189 domain-containing protein [Aliiroseovarius crassostreae]UWP89245.1 DUF2189 domain-containing protein [Aliiroseovarius crassostreae]UWQ01889.1 DUF2189 domain-containing protein [Aliiroseovarius crassostreae]
MVKTIGNPLSWMAQHVADAGHHVLENIDHISSKDAPPKLRSLHMADLNAALRLGYKDFCAARTEVMMLVVFYPVVGLILITMAFNMSLLPLLAPLMMGFALLGPVAAVGLYEISRRREAGEDVSFTSAIGVLGAPSLGGILVIGAYLFVLFMAWMLSAWAIYQATLGPDLPETVYGFAKSALTTPAGWMMIFLGGGVGFAFALVVLATTVISVPMLLDRKVGVAVAVGCSIQLVRSNPGVMLRWGVIVLAALLLGALPLLLGLVVVLPILGHATWHLYRKAVQRGGI